MICGLAGVVAVVIGLAGQLRTHTSSRAETVTAGGYVGIAGRGLFGQRKFLGRNSFGEGRTVWDLRTVFVNYASDGFTPY